MTRWNTSKNINEKFFDCKFHVNLGVICTQLLATIKQHVTSILDDFGKECSSMRSPWQLRTTFVGSHRVGALTPNCSRQSSSFNYTQHVRRLVRPKCESESECGNVCMLLLLHCCWCLLNILECCRAAKSASPTRVLNRYVVNSTSVFSSTSLGCTYTTPVALRCLSRVLLQMCFFARKDVAAKYNSEGEGHAEEGWVTNLPEVSAMCTDFSDVFFETMVKSRWQVNRMAGFAHQAQVNNWQLDSVNTNRQCSSDVSVIATSGACSNARTCTCHFLKQRDEILGCP